MWSLRVSAVGTSCCILHTMTRQRDVWTHGVTLMVDGPHVVLPPSSCPIATPRIIAFHASELVMALHFYSGGISIVFLRRFPGPSGLFEVVARAHWPIVFCIGVGEERSELTTLVVAMSAGFFLPLPTTAGILHVRNRANKSALDNS